MDIPSQATSRQALEVQSFHVDGVESPHQFGGGLEGVIPALAPDPLVAPRY
jgi:hypothetical protein